ncbi:hypothetical protein VE01_03754 [Pseudogymnoascus verrucosus]|uniref:UNC-45/Cro1/She4 central domain-containing protein n=1 Tax=Pseudogymnoascus verrucosus TaxID=342668 RepID=A0A1B8GQN6_9PEZI|nr:uncharacterized protein VE01_03754 [Pseudogymnoascus verrucosus]OBT98148.1 hypothetical protein VE01_03754 [Pseudogymnoascus verrucosus]
MSDEANPPLRQPTVKAGPNVDFSRSESVSDEVLVVLAGLVEGGQDDDETCLTLDALTRLLSRDDKSNPPVGEELAPLIDADCFDTLAAYLDMRQGDSIRGHATMTLSAYLKASGEQGLHFLTRFFKDKVQKGTYDDFIIAFSVAACTFPVIPDVSAELFLSPGFVYGLGPLMKRKWKSKKVEQACLDMLNVACMHGACREAIQKYCTEWLEEIVVEAPKAIDDLHKSERYAVVEDGPLQQRLHTPAVRNLAAVILAKLQAVPSAPADSKEKIQPAVTNVDELTDIFNQYLSTSDESLHKGSIEGLAYASLQPVVKEKIANDPAFLKSILHVLETNPPKSSTTYGGLSILVNLTTYLPSLTEEQKRITQLKAYANASRPSHEADPLNSDAHVAARCTAVFKAEAIPVLVSHSVQGSLASLKLIVQILLSISRSSELRGRIAQQGGVKLLLHAYNQFPETDQNAKRTTAHALARILISTNPIHIFGGSNPHPLNQAIRPLISLLSDDPTAEIRDLLPAFEALLALTNLASVDNDARDPIIRDGWSSIDELLLSNNTLVTRASVELVCNLMESPTGVAKFADGSKQASNRLHILLALADSEDLATRRAAGGALASLTQWDTAVTAILGRERGVAILLKLCKEDEEDLRHRGVVCVSNMLNAPGDGGEKATTKVKEADGIEALKECARKSRSQEVLEIIVEALQRLLGDSGTKSLQLAAAA